MHVLQRLRGFLASSSLVDLHDVMCLVQVLGLDFGFGVLLYCFFGFDVLSL